MLPPFDAYCRQLAELPSQFPHCQKSTLTSYTIGPFVAEVVGALWFQGDYVLEVWELLDLSTHTIQRYSYELRQGAERLWWYDPQEHPDDPALAATHPHHKHIPPDIKHHRVPAPGLSFTQPNLPVLLAEIKQLLSADADHT